MEGPTENAKKTLQQEENRLGFQPTAAKLYRPAPFPPPEPPKTRLVTPQRCLPPPVSPDSVSRRLFYGNGAHF
ncbi:hypothetical protein MRB53_021991 [Persea americana]|uniref:Uncharacterized protein n=1 Tax=Persea americana TaxID=3435 RepID=A0ACC2L5N6_PERAE|nr:hypothetical protein MRB53_021991 [Persea americana]